MFSSWTVACIIPTKDRAHMLPSAIESALEQEGGWVDEVIVVDDGSQDDTPAMLKSHFPMVHVVRGEGLGPGAARNLGAAASTSRCLMFLDSDDIWSRDHCAALSALLEQGHEVAYGVTETFNQCDGSRFFIPSPYDERPVSFRGLAAWCSLVPSAVAISRRAFMESGGFPPVGFGEDWLFFLDLVRRYRFGFHDGVITHRLLHAGSLCHQVGPQHMESLLRNICDYMMEYSVPPDVAELPLMHLRLVLEQGDSWSSVQDWYSAVLDAGILERGEE